MNDPFGRPVSGLRISVTDRCNLSCDYCHREGLPTTGSRGEMAPREIAALTALAREVGVGAVKLTGGEPLVRSDIVDVVEALSGIADIRDLSMTTNGVLLAPLARRLSDAGLSRVNVSLGTLDRALFSEVAGVDALDRVLAGIDEALAYLSPVKLNVVLTSRNARELDRLMGFARERGAILQVIELVDANLPCETFAGAFEPAAPLEARLEREAVSVVRRRLHARTRYRLAGGLEVEVVRSMHNSAFCANCTRLRLTADGHLKPCLMRNDNLVDALGPLRAGDVEGCRDALRRAVGLRDPFFR